MQISQTIVIIGAIITLISATDDPCNKITDCDKCTTDGNCAFWYCGQRETKPSANGTICESVHDSKPQGICRKPDKWIKIQRNDPCPSSPNTTTTTTTPSTTTVTTTTKKPNTTTVSTTIAPNITTTSTTIGPNITTTSTTIAPNISTTSTKAPDTTTANQTTSTNGTTTTSAPTPSPITSKAPEPQPQPPAPQPHNDTDRKLTGWAITGIVLSSLSVIVILVVVARKKVMKIYRARNPYRTLNE